MRPPPPWVLWASLAAAPLGAAGAASAGPGWVWIADYNYQRTDLPQRYQVVDLHGRARLIPLKGPGPLSPDGKHAAWAVRDAAGLSVLLDGRTVFGMVLPPQGMRLDSYVSGLSWSPDGAYLAFSIRDTRTGDVYLHRLADRDGKNPLLELECPAEAEGQWAPDGRRYACALGGELVFFEPATGARRRALSLAEPSEFFSDLHWSPDGARLAAFHGRMAGPEGGPPTRKLALVDAASGKETILVPDVDAVAGKEWTPGELRWSPDGKALSFSTRAELFLVDGGTGKTRPLVSIDVLEKPKPNEMALLDCPRWSLDAKTLVFLSSVGEKMERGMPSRRTLFAYDLRSKTSRVLLKDPVGACFEVRPSSP